jgi:DNA invertase Pin-like site-specific DNA recombinase
VQRSSATCAVDFGKRQAGCVRCFFDKASGKNTDRPELERMFDYIRPGDALTVVSLDRLGRSLEDLIAMVGRLKRHGVGFLSLHEKLDTTTAACLSSASSPPWPSSLRFPR